MAHQQQAGDHPIPVDVAENAENVQPAGDQQSTGKPEETVPTAEPNKKKLAFLNILNEKLSKRSKDDSSKHDSSKHETKDSADSTDGGASAQEEGGKKRKMSFGGCMPKLSGGKIACSACHQKKTPRNTFVCATCDRALFCAHCMLRDHRLHEILDGTTETPVQDGVEALWCNWDNTTPTLLPFWNRLESVPYMFECKSLILLCVYFDINAFHGCFLATLYCSLFIFLQTYILF
ncbi:unnamed protein product, partial [Mesorhabditis belari]|uniref:B box-type domain-containing protein n=1 Tax=Mesorhabditis belari TaxID=2138241 RepID=A0AAF3EN98_9BILA